MWEGEKGRGAGGFLDDHLCQAREQAREQRWHGQLTLACLSLVPTWAVTVFWERKGHSEVSPLFSGCLLPTSSRAGPPGKVPSLSGLVGGSCGWDRRLGVSAGDSVPDRRGEGIEAIGLQSVFINILLFYCPHVSWANFLPPFYPGMISSSVT